MKPQSKQDDMSICAINSTAKGKLCLEYSAGNPKKAECLFCHNSVTFGLIESLAQ
jgi:hypothetical protein